MVGWGYETACDMHLQTRIQDGDKQMHHIPLVTQVQAQVSMSYIATSSALPSVLPPSPSNLFRLDICDAAHMVREALCAMTRGRRRAVALVVGVGDEVPRQLCSYCDVMFEALATRRRGLGTTRQAVPNDQERY